MLDYSTLNRSVVSNGMSPRSNYNSPSRRELAQQRELNYTVLQPHMTERLMTSPKIKSVTLQFDPPVRGVVGPGNGVVSSPVVRGNNGGTMLGNGTGNGTKQNNRSNPSSPNNRSTTVGSGSPDATFLREGSSANNSPAFNTKPVAPAFRAYDESDREQENERLNRSYLDFSLNKSLEQIGAVSPRTSRGAPWSNNNSPEKPKNGVRAGGSPRGGSGSRGSSPREARRAASPRGAAAPRAAFSGPSADYYDKLDAEQHAVDHFVRTLPASSDAFSDRGVAEMKLRRQKISLRTVQDVMFQQLDLDLYLEGEKEMLWKQGREGDTVEAG